jgi:hypothetical protein
MIKYLGCFVEKIDAPTASQSRSVTDQAAFDKHNILLQFGESDLEEYFVDNAQPIMFHEIGSFWRSLFDVARAIERIHNLETSNGGFAERYAGFVYTHFLMTWTTTDES